MQVEQGAAAWRVTPPSWRFDIAIEEDLIEEVARIHGFDRIPETDPATPLAIPAIARNARDARDGRRPAGAARLPRGDHLQLRRSRAAGGAVPGRAVAAARQSDLRGPRRDARVAVAGPGAGARARTSGASSRACACSSSAASSGSTAGTLHEIPVLAGIAAGPALPEQWGVAAADVDFFDVRADVEAVLRATGAAGEFSFVPGDASGAAPGPVRADPARRRCRSAGWVACTRR